MDTNRLKKFATEARNILKAGIAARLTGLGFDRQGNVPDRLKPQLLQGGTLWNGRTLTEGFYHQWMRLYRQVQEKGVNEVYEQAAYTWFNRLVAIRILYKNGLCEAVSTYADSARTPEIVNQARQGIFPPMDEDTKRHLLELLDDDTKVTEQFAVLLVAWCHANPILQRCFGSMADYTELLLPVNILSENGFIDLLNHTEFITEEEYRSPELIGWLYQFYISERKDEVFAKKGKFEADEIPAATQIFTPNWIVKYMVQNTLGRIYLDNNPYMAGSMKEKWQYLVEPTEPTPSDAVLSYEELTDLKVADLACGSGHILNECFDLLYDLYIAEGYTRVEAITHIFQDNLTGVDLDPRAQQLALFALTLKACQHDRSFMDAHCLPRVLTMPKVDRYTYRDLNGHFCAALGLVISEDTGKELDEAFTLMEHADSLGSIMKFRVSPATRQFLQQAVDEQKKQRQFVEKYEPLMDGFEVILALTEMYDALVMNPPYMGGGNMNDVLSKYVKKNYEEAKGDLFSVFMDLAIDRLHEHGRYGMINMQSWMFLSSFERLRKTLLDNYQIESMLHLGPRTFDELSGEVVQNTAFVVTKHSAEQGGTYFRLVDGKCCADKERMFLQAMKEQTDKVYYPNVKQANFEKIPGSPIGYWVSEKIFSRFAGNLALSAVAKPCVGLQTADNARFVRLWFEVNLKKIGCGMRSAEEAKESELKWFPYNKGGTSRKWYGNQEYVVNWENDGGEIKNYKGAVVRNPNYYFRSSISWGLIASTYASFRTYPSGFIYDVAGMSLFPNDESQKLIILGWLNTKLFGHMLRIINPTINMQCGDVSRAPYLPIKNINDVVERNVKISKKDWDAHETSWDFQTSPLLACMINCGQNVADLDMLDPEEIAEIQAEHFVPTNSSLLQHVVEAYKSHWTREFEQLHRNEEKLNRQFIEIYDLEDELTPDVPLDEVTILQQGEITIVDNALKWNEDVILKQLLSYAVGIWMGRYRLDKPGLHIAHPNPTAEELTAYDYNGHPIEIDDDGIIPLMAADSGFPDNACLRTAKFISDVFGNQTQVENLNYMERTLGKTIEQYWQKDFWKDHKKMYQNRPIYWLFASKKGTFQCIAYLHRMNPYTAERIRSKYLLPFIEKLNHQISDLSARAADLSTAERKKLETLRKQLEECREYHDRLAVVAEQAISLDLDDGVVVSYAKFGDVVAKLK